MAEVTREEETAEDSEPDEAPARPAHFTLLRSFALADFITLANGAAGMSAVLLCLVYVEGRDVRAMWAALALLPLALAFDALDGMVARWRRRSSPLGADLDSLADVVSFGVAPAVVGFSLGLSGLWDALVLLYFVACGISRLARFNATADSLMTEEGKVAYFEGTPIPTSIVVVVFPLAIAFSMGAAHHQLWLGAWEIGPWTLHPLVGLYALSGTAMISATLRVPKP